MGLRYRLQRAVVEGVRRRQDIVFGPSRVIVDVRGCYWHGCPIHGTAPKANADWWAIKLAANIERDRDTERRAAEQGWETIVVWEHEDPAAAARRVAGAVNRRRP